MPLAMFGRKGMRLLLHPPRAGILQRLRRRSEGLRKGGILDDPPLGWHDLFVPLFLALLLGCMGCFGRAVRLS